MGLDQYLVARQATAPDTEVITEVGYWRKANMVHNWVETNLGRELENCEETILTVDDLLALKATCEKVLANHDLAPIEMPTASGFFFGSTEYDDWYFSDLRDTIGIVDKALALGEGWEVYYHGWW